MKCAENSGVFVIIIHVDGGFFIQKVFNFLLWTCFAKD
jgi:hypothetical protein